jgi:hypothetical protein
MSFKKTLISDRLIYKPLDSGYCNLEYLEWLNNEEVEAFKN